MCQQSLKERPRRRGLPKDGGQRSAIAENILDRQFRADAPNQKWVADFTHIWTSRVSIKPAAAQAAEAYCREIQEWYVAQRQHVPHELAVYCL